MMKNKQFRCSGLFNLTPMAKAKGEVLSQTAKSYIRSVVKEDHFEFRKFKGNKFTQKGNSLEDQAISLSGSKRFTTYEKNTIRANTAILTGEADIIDLDSKIIVDTKCTWDISTHPFFMEEARDKAKNAGYDIQIHGYFMAFEQYYKEQGLDIKFEHGEIDFWLLPCPEDLLGKYDDREMMIDLVNSIPLEKRCTTLKIERDESIIARIEQVVPHAQRYYKMLKLELIGDDF